MHRATRYLLTAAALGALAGPPLIFACGPGPTNFVDSNDLPSGGIRVNPGIVTCGTVDGGCDTTYAYFGCCVGPGEPGGAVCSDSGACPVGSGLVTCNETADCDVQPNGTLQACCATVHPDAGVSSSCTPKCAAPALQLCRTNGECPGDKCVVQKCADGQIYEMCGLSTSASFPCTAL